MTIVKKSLNELSISKDHLAELEAIKDKEIDYSDIPELDEQFWGNAEVRFPENKKGVYIRLDSDVLDWMTSQGKGYQSRINAILRSYYEAQKNEHTNNL
ncbi:MAG: BrnA antitoxin family protein [Methyloprofundus sp.]|nr:BrnA antitoxin family protein [Methyloprofundus sp.]